MKADKEKLVALIVISAVLIIANWSWIKTQFNEARFAFFTPLATIEPQKGISDDEAKELAKQAGVTETLVTRVIDGDTILIDGGQKVRYIGVNSPESVDPRRPVECFGKEAAAYNKKLVEGKKVFLKKDVSETDKYGRLLRYVNLTDGTFVNLKLVEDGYANVMTIPPDVKYSGMFVAAEKAARAAGKGLWSLCKY